MRPVHQDEFLDGSSRRAATTLQTDLLDSARTVASWRMGLQRTFALGADTALYQGGIVGLRGSQLVASLHSGKQHLRLAIDLDLSRADGVVKGNVIGTTASAGPA